MTKKTRSLMRKIDRDMNKVIDMWQQSCGHEGPVLLAMQAQDRLSDFIAAEIEALCQKAEEP